MDEYIKILKENITNAGKAQRAGDLPQDIICHLDNVEITCIIGLTLCNIAKSVEKQADQTERIAKLVEKIEKEFTNYADMECRKFDER